MYCAFKDHEVDYLSTLRTGEQYCFSCRDEYYRQLKQQRKERGEEKIQPLYSTPQFLLDFEVYNRYLYAEDANPEDAQSPGNIRFEYEGATYILWELVLRTNDPDAEEGTDCFYTEMACCMSNNVLVDQQDLEWRVVCWKGDAASDDRANEEILLPYDHALPFTLLALARKKWPKLSGYDLAFLNDLKEQQC